MSSMRTEASLSVLLQMHATTMHRVRFRAGHEMGSGSISRRIAAVKAKYGRHQHRAEKPLKLRKMAGRPGWNLQTANSSTTTRVAIRIAFGKSLWTVDKRHRSHNHSSRPWILRWWIEVSISYLRNP